VGGVRRGLDLLEDLRRAAVRRVRLHAGRRALSGQTDNQVQPPQTWAYVGTGTNSADPTIQAGSLSHPAIPTPIGNSVVTNRSQSGATRIALPSAVSANTVYFSMLVRVNDMTGLTNTTTGSFFAGLNSATGTGTSIASAGAALMIHLDPTNANAYNLGVAVSTANADRIFESTQRSAGQTLFVVGAYQFNAGADNDVSFLWVNPDASTYGAAAAPAPLVTSDAAVIAGTTTESASLASFFLRNNSVEPQQIQIDDVRVDTTWAGITALPKPGAAVALVALVTVLGRRR
jgi:hypothetical protein